jgi:DNA-binding response OmpR family regulator
MTVITLPATAHKRHILLIADNTNLRQQITAYFMQRYYHVSIANDTHRGFQMSMATNYDCILLGMTTQSYSNVRFIQQLRQCSNVPIIIISARNDQSEKIFALHMGADDYLCKSTNLIEIDARITAILRRIHATPQTRTTAYIQLDTESQSVRINGQTISITAMEYAIISTLFLSPGHVFSRKELTLLIYHEPRHIGRAIDVHISKIRTKIEPNPDNPVYIITVYGKGYMYQARPVVPSSAHE